MKCREADLAASSDGHSTAKSVPARRPSSAPPSGSDALPKVELDLPDAPAPLNSLPSLFEPGSPSGDDSKGTAMRIVRPAPPAPASSDGAAHAPSAPPRMRFANGVEQAPQAASPRVVMQWSAAQGSRETAESSPPDARTAVSSGAPRRPQWSPYR
jgi:hypothetical protein